MFGWASLILCPGFGEENTYLKVSKCLSINTLNNTGLMTGKLLWKDLMWINRNQSGDKNREIYSSFHVSDS